MTAAHQPAMLGEEVDMAEADTAEALLRLCIMSSAELIKGISQDPPFGFDSEAMHGEKGTTKNWLGGREWHTREK
ncbi:hypothetical protein GOP47_0029051 [Adiantum capillus-veneris]|nr:hypothetical protein GOP47_0029051 [Adiantum capillus-veneris]